MPRRHLIAVLLLFLLPGGVEIPPGSFEKVLESAILERVIDEAARKNIVCVRLRESGLCDRFAAIGPRGFPHPVRPAPEELFFNGEPMTIALWADESIAVAKIDGEKGEILLAVPRQQGGSFCAGRHSYRRPEEVCSEKRQILFEVFFRP